jgi:hypothetical protein
LYSFFAFVQTLSWIDRSKSADRGLAAGLCDKLFARSQEALDAEITQRAAAFKAT